jgi:hypothetical protein
MRPVRFVALSEDGQAFVLADEVGRLLALPIDDRVHTALRPDQEGGAHAAHPVNTTPSLAPRDIQARIRSGESAEEVARVAGVPVDRVLRYAGPVLQERAMLAQHARRTKLKTSDKGATLAEVVDTRLAQHSIDIDKISWDAYRREDGTWRITATWPSGKATAQAVWELDKARQIVSPYDEMAQYLCTDRTPHLLGQEPPAPERPSVVRGESSRGDLGRGESGRDLGRGDLGRNDLGRSDLGRGDRGHGGGRHEVGGHSVGGHSVGGSGVGGHGVGGAGGHGLGRSEVARGGHEPMRPGAAEPSRRPSGRGLGNDPIRAGRDALLASLDRPLGSDRRSAADPAKPAPAAASTNDSDSRARGAAALIGRSPFDDDGDHAKDVPAVPSLAVLRPRRNAASAAAGEQPVADKPRKRLPSWDDVLFGSAPAARETS